MVKVSYRHIKEYFTSKECTLLTTENEFNENNMNTRSNFKYISTCGHENEVIYYNFKCLNTGMICKQCSLQKQERKYKYLGYVIEYYGKQLVSELLQRDFIIKNTNPSCIADLVIKPINETEDRWLMVQLKVTRTYSHSTYNFHHLQKGYDDCLIICISLSDKKVWFFDYEDVKKSIRLHIGKDNSVYNRYLVNYQTGPEIATIFYNKKTLFSLDDATKPSSPSVQQELFYRSKREKELPFLHFENSIFDDTVYDFMIQGKKHQEKVATEVKKNIYIVQLCKHNGLNTKSKYVKGDNDFYWIWIKDTTIFFMFPEEVLLSKNIVLNNDTDIIVNNKHHFIISLKNLNWKMEYMFDLKNLNKEKLLQLINYDINLPYTKYQEIPSIDILQLPKTDLNFLTKNIEQLKQIISRRKIDRTESTGYITIDTQIEKNQNQCINCNSSISDTASRCIHCSKLYMLNRNDDINNTEINRCIDCNIAINTTSERCVSCVAIYNNQKYRKVKNRPSLEQLRKDLLEHQYYNVVGRIYNVSDNCIRKWIRIYENQEERIKKYKIIDVKG